mgnify:CR=1 FL=1
MANSEAFKMQSGSRRRSVAGGLHGFRATVMVVVLMMMMMAIVLHVSAGDADASYKGLTDKEKYGLKDGYGQYDGYTRRSYGLNDGYNNKIYGQYDGYNKHYGTYDKNQNYGQYNYGYNEKHY